MRATTAMTGGQLASSTGLNAAQQFGALGQATSGMGMADAQALAASGQQQENLDQAGLNTAYSNASSLNNYDWNILNNMNSVIRGMQLPTSTTVTSNQPANATTQPYGSSPLTQLGALYFGTGKAKGGPRDAASRAPSDGRAFLRGAAVDGRRETPPRVRPAGRGDER
jgi:hypothetical protein